MTDAADSPPPPEEIKSDLDLVIGGAFNVDEIGPQRHAEVTERLRAHPDVYLDAFEEHFLGAEFDPVLHSRLHAPRLLRILRGTDPDRVRRTADAILRHLRGTLVVLDDAPDRSALENALPEETVNTLARLDDRRRSIRALLDEMGG